MVSFIRHCCISTWAACTGPVASGPWATLGSYELLVPALLLQLSSTRCAPMTTWERGFQLSANPQSSPGAGQAWCWYSNLLAALPGVLSSPSLVSEGQVSFLP